MMYRRPYFEAPRWEKGPPLPRFYVDYLAFDTIRSEMAALDPKDWKDRAYDVPVVTGFKLYPYALFEVRYVSHDESADFTSDLRMFRSHNLLVHADGSMTVEPADHIYIHQEASPTMGTLDGIIEYLNKWPPRSFAKQKGRRVMIDVYVVANKFDYPGRFKGAPKIRMRGYISPDSAEIMRIESVDFDGREKFWLNIFDEKYPIYEIERFFDRSLDRMLPKVGAQVAWQHPPYPRHQSDRTAESLLSEEAWWRLLGL